MGFGVFHRTYWKNIFPSWRNIFSQVGKKQSSAKLANLQVVTATAPKVLCF
jgi:hypothetical protein